MPCPDKPEGKRLFITKPRKYETTKKSIRIFVFSCFRGYFYFIYHKNTNLNVKELTCLSSI